MQLTPLIHIHDRLKATVGTCSELTRLLGLMGDVISLVFWLSWGGGGKLQFTSTLLQGGGRAEKVIYQNDKSYKRSSSVSKVGYSLLLQKVTFGE